MRSTARLLAIVVASGALGCAGGGKGSRHAPVDAGAAALVASTIEGDPSFRELGADDVLARIDDVALGEARALWRRDALGEWEVLPGGARAGVVAIVEDRGALAARVALPWALHRRVSEVARVGPGSDGSGRPSRTVEFTWAYEDAPSWLGVEDPRGDAVLVKSESNDWSARELHVAPDGDAGHILRVAGLEPASAGEPAPAPAPASVVPRPPMVVEEAGARGARGYEPCVPGAADVTVARYDGDFLEGSAADGAAVTFDVRGVSARAGTIEAGGVVRVRWTCAGASRAPTSIAEVGHGGGSAWSLDAMSYPVGN